MLLKVNDNSFDGLPEHKSNKTYINNITQPSEADEQAF